MIPSNQKLIPYPFHVTLSNQKLIGDLLQLGIANQNLIDDHLQSGIVNQKLIDDLLQSEVPNQILIDRLLRPISFRPACCVSPPVTHGQAAASARVLLIPCQSEANAAVEGIDLRPQKSQH